MVILEFQLPTRGAMLVELPKGAKILGVQNANHRLTAWAVVDPAAPLVNRRFYIATSGEDLDGKVSQKDRHVGTVQFTPYVAHVFEVAG